MSLPIPHWPSLRLSSGIKPNHTCTSLWKTVAVDIYQVLSKYTMDTIERGAIADEKRARRDDVEAGRKEGYDAEVASKYMLLLLYATTSSESGD